MLLFEIILNTNNSSQMLIDYSKQKSLKIPTIYQNTISFLNCFDNILMHVELKEENSFIIELLNNMVQSNLENFKIFKENLGFLIILRSN